MNRPDKAIKSYQQCNTSDTVGIGLGTVSYLMYLAESALQNQASAEKYLRIAVESGGSTIIHGDGPFLNDIIQ